MNMEVFGSIDDKFSHVDNSFLRKLDGAKIPKRLLGMCIAKLVEDGCFAIDRLPLIPADLHSSLMQEAIKQRRPILLQHILVSWSSRFVSLQSVQPIVQYVPHLLYCGDWRVGLERQMENNCTMIGQAYIEVLRKHFSSAGQLKLKILDLRNLPANNLMVQFFSAHTILAFNESKHKKIIDQVQQLRDRARISESFAEKFGQFDHFTLPEDSYIIIADCKIQEQSTFEDFCKALKVNQVEQSEIGCSSFKLMVNKLALRNIGFEGCKLVLELLDSQSVTGLNFSCNDLQTNLIDLAPAIQSYQKITSLDLSFNGCSFSENDDLCAAVCDMIAGLSCLKRLSLHNNPVGPRLRRLIWRHRTGLTFLNVCRCRLTSLDIQYLGLADTIHATTITQLVLSDNQIGISNGTVETLIKTLLVMAPQLTVLELERCSLRSNHLIELLPVFSELTKLEFLNLALNEFDKDVMKDEFIKLIAPHPSLTRLMISYPRDLYSMYVNPWTMSAKLFRILYGNSLRSVLFTKRGSRSNSNAIYLDAGELYNEPSIEED